MIPFHVALRAATRFVEEGDCFISTYSTGSHGYAQVGWSAGADKRTCTTAHRAAWSSVHGQIPEGMTVDHMCKTRRCVRVEHLRLLTNYENARRTKGLDWPVDGRCVNGHDPSETYLRKSSQNSSGVSRACRPCDRMHKASHRARKAG